MRHIALLLAGRRRAVTLFTVAVAAVAALLWYWMQPADPDEIANEAARAFATADVDRLLALTLPQERTKLHLTAPGISALLDNSLYTGGIPRSLKAVYIDSAPPDVRQYELIPTGGGPHKFRSPMRIKVMWERDGTWHLVLSESLMSIRFTQLHASQTGYQEYEELCKRYGILGFRDRRGYTYWGHAEPTN
jgi:hypothetical protein